MANKQEINAPESGVLNHVRVGVGVLVQDPKQNGKIFAGIRKGSHGSGLLSLPGGHLEMMEEWEDCAKREVEEETGLLVEVISFLHVTNDPMPAENKRKLKTVERFLRLCNLFYHKNEALILHHISYHA